MAVNSPLPGVSGSEETSELILARRLERGEVVYFPRCPFPLPEGDDRRFLLEQRLGSRAHKNISYSPHTAKVSGFGPLPPDQKERLGALLGAFSQTATAWLAGALPGYARAWDLDLVSFRPEEEATRRLRLTSRNDLLHVDAFPSRPTNGRRILRLFANVNLSEPRVWVTSDTFPKLLVRYGKEAGLPAKHPHWAALVRRQVLGLFRPGRPRRSAYDEFMLRFHDYLKTNEEFQEQCSKRFWQFPPGSAWLVITDTATHAALRGRYAIEHSYFIAPETLVLPDEAPAALLARACGMAVVNRAA